MKIAGLLNASTYSYKANFNMGLVKKLLIANFVISIAHNAFADVISIDGSITTSDFLGEEDQRPGYPIGTWTFYYDVYNITAIDGDSTVSISMTSTDFELWFGIWDQMILPEPWWIARSEDYEIETNLYHLAIERGYAQNGNPTVVTTINSLSAGDTYQLAIATLNYLPTPLGNYQVTFSSDSSINITQVPEPGTLALIGIGLAGIRLARRRKCMSSLND